MGQLSQRVFTDLLLLGHVIYEFIRHADMLKAFRRYIPTIRDIKVDEFVKVIGISIKSFEGFV